MNREELIKENERLKHLLACADIINDLHRKMFTHFNSLFPDEMGEFLKDNK